MVGTSGGFRPAWPGTAATCNTGADGLWSWLVCERGAAGARWPDGPRPSGSAGRSGHANRTV